MYSIEVILNVVIEYIGTCFALSMIFSGQFDVNKISTPRNKGFPLIHTSQRSVTSLVE